MSLSDSFPLKSLDLLGQTCSILVRLGQIIPPVIQLIFTILDRTFVRLVGSQNLGVEFLPVPLFILLPTMNTD